MEDLKLMHPANPSPLIVMRQPVYREEPEAPLGLSDLRMYANALAEEFGHHPERALWEPSGWYRAQVGEEVCDFHQAMLLREMTIERCREVTYAGSPPRALRRMRALDVAGIVIVTAVLLCCLLGWYLSGLAPGADAAPQNVPVATDRANADGPR